MSAQTRKQSSNDAAYGKVRKIGENSRCSGDGKSGENLADIMEQPSQSACEERKSFPQQAVGGIHDSEAEDTARQTVEQA